MSILYISNVVPDREPFNGAGFARSANNVLTGIADALPADTVNISCRPIASWPNGPLWLKRETVELESGRKIEMLPTLNIKILKQIFWGWKIRGIVKRWSCQQKEGEREVLVYNLYTPPVKDLINACHHYGCRLTAILYDLGVPPKRLKLSRATMMGYRHMEKQFEKYIPQLDGRVIINESIIRHYAPDKDFLLVDGGINDGVIARLFPLEESQNERFTFVLAGMLWDQNGTKMVLDCLSAHPEIKADFVFAGIGLDVPIIAERAKSDPRIHYAGMLSPDELFKLYERADVLLNLRIEEEVDFHFPSKLLEYMATGKHVISTSIAHAERDYGEFITIINENSPDALASAIKYVMACGKKNIYEQGVRARTFMIEKRNWRYQTKRILDYINRRK